MDSGNSDSFQSSNGGDEEYNSRGGGDGSGSGSGTISAFISQAASRGGLIYNTPLNQSMFDNYPILPNYQNLQNNNMLLKNSLDMVWSNPNCTAQQPVTIHQNSNELMDRIELENGKICMPSSSSVEEIMNISTSRTSSLPVSEHHQTHGLPSVQNQNPKKRSRASRRAPTTVLTTDTNNFRAMVQEFTGIPAPPFTSSSLFSRNINNNTKLDNLFGTPSSSMRLSNPLDYSISPYLRRPFPQKLQPSSPSMFGASMIDSLRTNVEDSYQQLQSPNDFNMQNNPILTSLLHSNHAKPSFPHHSSVLGSKTHQGSVQIPPLSNGFLQSPLDNNNAGLAGELPGLVSADPTRWGGGRDGGVGERVRTVGNSTNNGDGKRLKGMMEDGARNGEGMMETWICSSSE